MASERHVHVVDDDEAVRRSTAFLLKVAGYTVELWPTGTAFLTGVRQASPGCVLLDIRMPGMDGLVVQRVLAESGIAWPVIIVTGHGDVATAIQAMKAGATDFLEKPMARETLLEAVEGALAKLHDRSRLTASSETARVAIARLTPREQATLAGLAKGLSNRGIAEALEISPRTVEVHRANAMGKLDAESLSQALRIAFAAGLDQAELQLPAQPPPDVPRHRP